MMIEHASIGIHDNIHACEKKCIVYANINIMRFFLYKMENKSKFYDDSRYIWIVHLYSHVT